MIDFDDVDTKMAVGLLAGATSLLVAILTQIFSPISQRRIEKYKAGLQRDLEKHSAAIQNELERHKSEQSAVLEKIKSDLANQNSESAARRDYQYEARKRLYAEVEPLFLQLYEATEEAYHRVRSLSRTSKLGHLGTGEATWMKNHGDYLITTAYKMFKPVMAFRLLQQRITFVDLRLSPIARLRYLILKNYVYSFTDHFDFAALAPRLDYAPRWEDIPSDRRATERHQGLLLGDLERVLDAFMSTSPTRIPSLAEFESLSADQVRGKAVDRLTALYVGFSPDTDPVLARMLIAQAGLAYLLMETFKGAGNLASLRERVKGFYGADNSILFAWSPNIPSTDIHVIRPYLEACLSWIESAP